MANVNTINLGGMNNADLQAQQIALQRKQAIIDAIRQQSISPDEQQVVSNRVVPISPIQGLTKLGEAYFAKKGEEKNTQAQIDLGNEAAKRSAAALRALAPAGTFDSSSGTPNFSTTPNFSLNGPQPAPTPQPTSGSPAVSDPVKQGWIRALSVYQTDPELGKKLVENMAQLTEEQKNMAAKGIDPQLAGALMIAKMRAEGTKERQPGTTQKDYFTGQEVFQPTLAPGINLNNGVASQVPGYADAQAGIMGQTKSAEAGANAQYDLIPITTPDGKTMMVSKAQAAQMAGAVPRGTPPGQPPQGATPQAPQQPPQAPQMPPQAQPGIPLQSPDQAAINAAKAPAAVEAAKVKTAAQPLYAAIEDAKKLVDKLPHGATAGAEAWASNQHLIGNPEKAAAVAQWNNIMGNFTMQGIASSGLGRMDIPIVNAINKASQVPMDAAPAAKQAALNEIKALLDRHVASMQNVVGELNQPGITQTTGQLPMAPVEGTQTPSIDDLLKKYGPK